MRSLDAMDESVQPGGRVVLAGAARALHVAEVITSHCPFRKIQGVSWPELQ